MMVSAFAALRAITCDAANTWYVDDDNYKAGFDAAAYIEAGFDGTTEAKAFGTIQAAIDATLDGDTIVVLPGMYDKGGRELTWVDKNGETQTAGDCRVVITKNNLIIRSRDGAASAHIVGQKASTESGNGTGAIRCVGQYQQYGVQLRGFTLRDGATADTSTQVKYGGAFYSQANNSDFAIYLVDSIISNCCGVSSITRNGTIARTFIAENQVSGKSAPVASGTQFYSCVFARNKGDYILSGSNTKAVHCTLVGNLTTYAAKSDVTLYNSIISLSCDSVEFDGGVPQNAAGNATQSEYGNYQTVAPLLDDYRVIEGVEAEEAGDAQYTSAETLTAFGKKHFPSDIVNKDFFGRSIGSEGGEFVVAGAVAESVLLAGGAIAFDKLDWTSRVVVNGIASCKDDIYAYPVKYPVQWRVTPELSTGKLFCWSTSADHGYAHFSDTNDVAYLMPPPDVDSVMTNSLALAKTPVWLSPDGDDYDGDGSFDNPYQTLAKGVAAAGSGNRLIYCKRGTYNKGEAYGGGRTNRVYLNEQSARFVAVDGKEVTFIEGAAASEKAGSDETFQGCGTDAIAGVYVNGSPRVCFIGFTFRNCHTVYGSGGNAKEQGAVVRATALCTSLMDCDIVDNSAIRGVARGAKLIRCKISNNNVNGALWRESLAFGCEISNNSFTPEANAMGYNCTYLGDSPAGSCFACIGANGESVPSNLSYIGSLFYNYASNGGTGYITDDPLMVGTADGRVSKRSPAYSCGVKPNGSSDAEGASYYKVADYALDGVPLTLTDDGRPMAGAYQCGVDGAVTVLAANGGISVSSGTMEVSRDETLEIAAGNPGSRPCYGYVLNGTTNLFDEIPSRILTAANVSAAGAMVIEALYAPHWYVDANSGDDDNTGFTPKTAKQTLAAACTIPELSDGDTIHAAPGSYASKSVLAVEGEDGHTIRSRVSVRSNTTLVADKGPECTFIVGEPASGETDGDDTRNCGAGAVRCAYLNKNSTISGFTLTGGRTRCRTGKYYSDDDSGGGILGVNSSNCLGENLIISNNASFRGGAARYATLRKCRIYDNIGYNKGAIGSESSFIGCVADGNIGPDPVYYYRGIADCTFGSGNLKRDGALAQLPGTPSSSSYVSNTITRCLALATNVYTRTYCVAVDGNAEDAPGLIVVDESNLQLDVDLRPKIGANAAIDQAVGDVAQVPDPEFDALGGQRVYNGVRDCGALEADWRDRYGRDIGSRFAVASVSSGVCEQTGRRVRVPEGGVLEGEFEAHGGNPGDVYFSFSVSDGGSAKLSVDGTESVHAGGVHELKIRLGEYPLSVRVEAESGYVDILQAKRMKGFVITVK